MKKSQRIAVGLSVFLVLVVCWAFAPPVEAEYEYDQELLATDGGPGDLAGRAVDIYWVGASDFVAIVGAPGEAAAYIFRYNGTNWTQEDKLTIGGLDATDGFGASVGIHGDYAVVGAWGVDVDPDDDTGEAYVFHHSAGNWTFDETLSFELTPAIDDDDNFGQAVSIDNQRIVVGAPGWNYQRGEAFVFWLNAGDWQQEGNALYDDNPLSSEYFGRSVCIDDYAVSPSEGRVIVGLLEGVPEKSGAACVFEDSGPNWAWEAELRATSPAFNVQFGNSVWIQGDPFSGVYAAVGEPLRSSKRGAVYVFYRPPAGSWGLQQTLARGSADDRFGSSVSLAGDNLIVGAPTEMGTSAGAVYAYRRVVASWYLESPGRITPSSGQNGDFFGRSVSVVGGHNFVAGSPGDDSKGADAGSAHIYDFQSSGLLGACCDTLTLNCTEVLEEYCDGVDQIFLGEGTSCSTNPCGGGGEVPTTSPVTLIVLACLVLLMGAGLLWYHRTWRTRTSRVE